MTSQKESHRLHREGGNRVTDFVSLRGVAYAPSRDEAKKKRRLRGHDSTRDQRIPWKRLAGAWFPCVGIEAISPRGVSAWEVLKDFQDLGSLRPGHQNNKNAAHFFAVSLGISPFIVV